MHSTIHAVCGQQKGQHRAKSHVWLIFLKKKKKKLVSRYLGRDTIHVSPAQVSRCIDASMHRYDPTNWPTPGGCTRWLLLRRQWKVLCLSNLPSTSSFAQWIHSVFVPARPSWKATLNRPASRRVRDAIACWIRGPCWELITGCDFRCHVEISDRRSSQNNNTRPLHSKCGHTRRIMNVAMDILDSIYLIISEMQAMHIIDRLPWISMSVIALSDQTNVLGKYEITKMLNT